MFDMPGTRTPSLKNGHLHKNQDTPLYPIFTSASKLQGHRSNPLINNQTYYGSSLSFDSTAQPLYECKAQLQVHLLL